MPKVTFPQSRDDNSIINYSDFFVLELDWTADAREMTLLSRRYMSMPMKAARIKISKLFTKFGTVKTIEVYEHSAR